MKIHACTHRIVWTHLYEWDTLTTFFILIYKSWVSEQMCKTDSVLSCISSFCNQVKCDKESWRTCRMTDFCFTMTSSEVFLKSASSVETGCGFIFLMTTNKSFDIVISHYVNRLLCKFRRNLSCFPTESSYDIKYTCKAPKPAINKKCCVMT